MKYFNFERLVKKYSCEFDLISPENGAFDDTGNYSSSKIKSRRKGAIIGLNDGKIFRSSGTLTDKDKYLFVFEPVTSNDIVIHKGERYRVETQTENAEFTGVYVYTLKYVSAFEENGEQEGENYD